MWVDGHGSCRSSSAHKSRWRPGRGIMVWHVCSGLWASWHTLCKHSHWLFSKARWQAQRPTGIVPCSAPKGCMPFINHAGILCCWDEGSGYNRRQMFYVRRKGVRLTAGAENLGCFLSGSAVFLKFITHRTVSGRKCHYILRGPLDRGGRQCVSILQTPNSWELFNPFLISIGAVIFKLWGGGR